MKGKIANLGVNVYCAEMGQKKPIAQMEARLTYGGGHYRVVTPLELKGRGITFLSQYTAETIVGGADNPKVGWNVYQVTYKAFDKLKEQYAISMESLLD